MNRSTPGLPVHHQLPEFTQTDVHRVSDAIQPSHPLSSPSPPAPNLSQHQSLFQWVNFSHEVAKLQKPNGYTYPSSVFSSMKLVTWNCLWEYLYPENQQMLQARAHFLPNCWLLNIYCHITRLGTSQWNLRGTSRGLFSKDTIQFSKGDSIFCMVDSIPGVEYKKRN